MTYNVVILKSARYEYESIVGYLAQILKNPRAAGIFVAEFEYQLDLLREQPLLRPLSRMQELAARNYRSFPVNNTCVFTSLSTKRSISPTPFIGHRTTPAWSNPQAEYLARAHLRVNVKR